MDKKTIKAICEDDKQLRWWAMVFFAELADVAGPDSGYRNDDQAVAGAARRAMDNFGRQVIHERAKQAGAPPATEKMRVDVYCPKGFNYTHPNEVKVYCDGKDLTREVYAFVKVQRPNVEGEVPFADLKVYRGMPGTVIVTTYGESFGLEDWAEIMHECFSCDLFTHDGKEYPKR